MADLGYWSWPLDLIGSYEQIRREIKDIEIPFREKKKQVLWRGAVRTNTQRVELMRVVEGKDRADMKDIGWKSSTEVKAGDVGEAMSIPDHCLYQFVLQTEGHSYSGRGKYLHNCNFVVIIPKRKWIEPHHSLLTSENFIEVEDDFSDLESKIRELIEDQEKAESIARRSTETFRDRHLTPAAQNCYWRKLIEGWAEVSFVPEMWEEKGIDGKRRIRGVSFETFAIQAVRGAKSTCSWFRGLMLRC